MAWADTARAMIAEATENLPESAGLRERRAVLRTIGWKFHGYTSWGKKVWSRECRKYLELHGLPPRKVADMSPQSKLFQRMQAGDITFPFKP